MDWTDAVADALRAASAAEAELERMCAPRIAHWVGSAATAAHDALDDVDTALSAARSAASDYLSAARRAAARG